MKCQCESDVQCGHCGGSCEGEADMLVHTIYGRFFMCGPCWAALPSKYESQAAEQLEGR